MASEEICENDRDWFPKWLRRYATTFPKGLTDELAVNRDTTLRFSRSLLEAGAPAWQRYQAVRSLECYRDMILQRSQPDLSNIIAKLAQLGKQERNLELHAPPTDEELSQIRGKMDRGEPALVQTMRGPLNGINKIWRQDLKRCTCRLHCHASIPMLAGKLGGDGCFREYHRTAESKGDSTA